MEPDVLSIGEVLWDVFPDRRLLGGAPFNVACHVRAFGIPSAMVSRVGNDDPGREILERARQAGVLTDAIQVDDRLPTGQVLVRLDPAGVPEFRILAPSAWDAIQPDPVALRYARQAKAVVFGSLAQRREPSRSTIRQLLNTPALKVFDVNLRPPFDQRQVVEYLLYRSNVVKLNDAEMGVLGEWFELEGDLPERMRRMACCFGLRTVCVTRGAAGAVLWHEGTLTEHPGYRVEVVDTVGSGDAFLAGLLFGLLQGMAPAETLALANAAGAYVAGRPGATPTLDLEAIHAMARS